MKEWPTDNATTVQFDEMTLPVIAAIRFAYDLKRRNETHDIPYAGLNIGQGERACSPDPGVRLEAENLLYCENDQGRDALEEIVGLAVQLGIEQGRRLQNAEYLKLETIRQAVNLAKQ